MDIAQVYDYILDWHPQVEGSLLNMSTFLEMKPRDIENYIDDLLREGKIRTTWENCIFVYCPNWE